MRATLNEPAGTLSAAAVATLLVLSGCGSFQPFATPFVRRPPMPVGDPWPVPVEVAIDRLEVLGYSCSYEPPSDIPGGWHCNRNGGPNVGLDSDENGPILSALVFMMDLSEPPPAREVMDARAVTVFSDEVLPALMPEQVVPSDGDLLAMVQKGWPAELEDGWVLGFDRASNHRTLHVVYVEPDDED